MDLKKLELPLPLMQSVAYKQGGDKSYAITIH